VKSKQLVACALALTFSVTAWAQTTPPPALPTVPDEPLPEWHPPATRSAVPIFLTVSPEMIQAQKFRQAGLWISSIGWLQFFASGILYATAKDVNTSISNPRTTGTDPYGNAITDTTFDVAGEDKRNRLETSSMALAITGGAMALGGFVLFTVGQARISSFHKRHPKEPLPPLSGF
jgi:hypothetical protein